MKKKLFALSIVMVLLLFATITAQDLKPGDGVRITLYNISDQISGDYFIQQTGKIQLPYIGLINVQNRNFNDIHQEIIAKYDSLYRNPEITVQPLFRVSVLGAVQNPGIYFVTGVEKLLDVIALAGGETKDANLNKIYLVHKNSRIDINAKDMIQRGKKVQDIGLNSGDQIYVPKKWLSGAKNISIIVSGVAVLVAIIRLVTVKR